MAKVSGLEKKLKELINLPKDEPSDDEKAEIQCIMPLPIFTEKNGELVKNQLGRPKGASNKSTKDTIKYMTAMGITDPLVGLGSMWSMPTWALASLLSCKKLEAAKLQKGAMDTGVKFYHAPRAPETQAGDVVPVLQIFTGDGTGKRVNYFDFSGGNYQGDDKNEAIEGELEVLEDNQSLSKDGQ